MISQNSLIGAATKSLANNTASKWFKKNVWRSKPEGQRNKSTHSQLTNNAFFKSSQVFVSNFLDILKIGYRNRILNQPLYSWLIGYFLKSYPDNLSPHESIDYSLVDISEGTGSYPSGIYIINFDPKAAFRIGWDPLPPPSPGYIGYHMHLAWQKTDLSYHHSKINIPINSLVSHFDPTLTNEMPGDVIRIWYFFTEDESGLVSPSFTQLFEIQFE